MKYLYVFLLFFSLVFTTDITADASDLKIYGVKNFDKENIIVAQTFIKH